MKSESKNTGKVYRPEKDSEPESDLERFPARPHTRRLGEPAVTAPPARPLARQTADIHSVGDHDRVEAKDATVGERTKAGRPGTARHRQSPCTSQEGKLGRRLHDHSDKQRSPCLSACTRRPKDATATPGAVPVAHGRCSGGEDDQTVAVPEKDPQDELDAPPVVSDAVLVQPDLAAPSAPAEGAAKPAR